MTLPNDETPSLFGNAFELPQTRSKGSPRSGPQRSQADATAACEPSAAALEIARVLPHRLYLGTSSWSFPGWRGLVYRDACRETQLAREGLTAYARHPLFRSVGIDKTYYQPASRDEFTRLAQQVPDGFRFLVKAWRTIVEPEPFGGGDNHLFLEPTTAVRECVAPALEGLGAKCGPLLFQFPPMRRLDARAMHAFIARVRTFFRALPSGPLYAVEVRNEALVGPEFGEMLAEAGVVPCLTVHPTMPDLERQSRELALDPSKPLVMRWMLRANHRYDEAKDLYAPFDRVAEPDDASRDALARLARAALGAGLGAWIIVNNKAEGSSPLSVERVARAIVSEPRIP